MFLISFLKVVSSCYNAALKEFSADLANPARASGEYFFGVSFFLHSSFISMALSIELMKNNPRTKFDRLSIKSVLISSDAS